MYQNNMGGSSEYIDRIKAIPILDICRALNIDVTKRGSKHWCKLRADERTASTVLNVDKHPNTYVDFGGTNKESDVIQFVAEARGTDRSDATKYLAARFGIKRESQNVYSSDLAIWEWEKLGLHGDLATKNFSFDIERQGIQQVAELSQKYGMPMNELRKKHPKMYEQLLWDHALPHIRYLRNDYYLSLINLHHMLKIDDFSKHPDLRESFSKDIDRLRDAEWLLRKACVRTSIEAYQPGEYDPDLDMKKVLSGEVRPTIGNNSYKQLNAAASHQKCEVKYRTIPWSNFTFHALDMFPHSAFFKGDQVVVGYLSKDYDKIRPILDKMVGLDRNAKDLQHKIADAEQKKMESEKGPSDHSHPAPDKNRASGRKAYSGSGR